MTYNYYDDLQVRYNEYRDMCKIQGTPPMPMDFHSWLSWDLNVYQPYVRTAANPLSPATYQRLYGNKTMDEYDQKISPTLLREAQDRIQLLEDQLRLTEAALKTTQEERENYYNRNQSLESICNDMRSKVTALEHALGDVGEANSSLRDRLNKSFTDRDQEVEAIGKQAAEYLVELDKIRTEYEKLKSTYDQEVVRSEHFVKELKKARHPDFRHPYCSHRPSLVTVEEDNRGKYRAMFKCLPCDVRKGDLLADYENECVVREIIATYDGYTVLYNNVGESTFAPNELVNLHRLAPEEVPSSELMGSNQITTPVTPKTPANAVKYPHYFREVTNTTHIDVSWILKAYNVPCCEGHAIKKLLVSGQRGAKNRMQDLKEARDSIDRAIELEEESK